MKANARIKTVCYTGLWNTESSNLCAIGKPSMLVNSDNVHIHAGKLKVKLLATKCKHKLRANYAQCLLQGAEQMGFISC
jgi:hypothetical protein